MKDIISLPFNLFFLDPWLSVFAIESSAVSAECCLSRGSGKLYISVIFEFKALLPLDALVVWSIMEELTFLVLNEETKLYPESIECHREGSLAQHHPLAGHNRLVINSDATYKSNWRLCSSSALWQLQMAIKDHLTVYLPFEKSLIFSEG